MKKNQHLALLLIGATVSLTSCRMQWNEEERMPQPNQQDTHATRAHTNNVIYLDQILTRYANNPQKAFNSVTRKGITVVDFYADWCGPCRKLGEIIEDIAPSFPHVTFLKLNVDQFKSLSSSVRSIPVLAFYKNGKEVKRTVGMKSKKELSTLINSL